MTHCFLAEALKALHLWALDRLKHTNLSFQIKNTRLHILWLVGMKLV